MHLLLTDRLTCPRCGPEFGLILLANRMTDRRVHDGVLGCPNCRDSFPIREGFSDLRGPPRGELPTGYAGDDPRSGSAPEPASGYPAGEGGGEGDPATGSPPAPEASRLRALLDTVSGPGTVALIGESARHAAALAALVDELQVVVVDPDSSGWEDAPGVSRIVSGPGLPFFSRNLRGVVVDGRLGLDWVEEAARVVAPRARAVVTRAPEGALAVLEASGLSVLASEAETVVATRS